MKVERKPRNLTPQETISAFIKAQKVRNAYKFAKEAIDLKEAKDLMELEEELRKKG